LVGVLHVYTRCPFTVVGFTHLVPVALIWLLRLIYAFAVALLRLRLDVGRLVAVGYVIYGCVVAIYAFGYVARSLHVVTFDYVVVTLLCLLLVTLRCLICLVVVGYVVVTLYTRSFPLRVWLIYGSVAVTHARLRCPHVYVGYVDTLYVALIWLRYVGCCVYVYVYVVTLRVG